MPGGPGVRLDSCLFRGMEVTPHYDSMLAKLVVHAADRPTAIARTIGALQEMRLVGVATSIPVALRALESELFRSGDYDTSVLEKIDRSPPGKTLDIALLAAAVGKYLHTEEVDTGSAGGGGAGTGSGNVSMWKLVDRVERLGGRIL